MERVYKKVSTTIKEVNEKRRQVRMTLTSLEVDRDGDVVVPMGARLDAYLKNPIVLMGHMPLFPIANIVDIDPKDKEMDGVVEFFEKDESPLAERMFKLYSRRKMRAGSIGFMPMKLGDGPILPGQTGRTYQEWERSEERL